MSERLDNRRPFEEVNTTFNLGPSPARRESSAFVRTFGAVTFAVLAFGLYDWKTNGPIGTTIETGIEASTGLLDFSKKDSMVDTVQVEGLYLVNFKQEDEEKRPISPVIRTRPVDDNSKNVYPIDYARLGIDIKGSVIGEIVAGDTWDQKEHQIIDQKTGEAYGLWIRFKSKDKAGVEHTFYVARRFTDEPVRIDTSEAVR